MISMRRGRIGSGMRGSGMASELAFCFWIGLLPLGHALYRRCRSVRDRGDCFKTDARLVVIRDCTGAFLNRGS